LLPLWENVEKQIGNMDVMEFLARPTNMACHNLLRRNNMPAGTPQLLGHGLNFCVKPASTNEMISNTFNRLEKDIRRMWALRGLEDDGDYNPSIYLKSKYEFKMAPRHVEEAMKTFKKSVKERLSQLQQRRLRKKVQPIPTEYEPHGLLKEQ
jgi:hypothetical protein